MKLIKWLFVFLITIFFVASLLIMQDGLRDQIDHADLAVVLGNKIEKEGHPSKALQARLDKCAELYQAGWFPYILVSGGDGKEGYNEAVEMKKYLIQKGIPEKNIWVDSQGDTTYLTAKHTAELMKKQNFQKVMVISQYFHITRSKLALSQFGVHTLYTAHASLFLWRDFYSVPREVVGCVFYFFRSY